MILRGVSPWRGGIPEEGGMGRKLVNAEMKCIRGSNGSSGITHKLLSTTGKF
jgi:hypothetical protein